MPTPTPSPATDAGPFATERHRRHAGYYEPGDRGLRRLAGPEDAARDLRAAAADGALRGLLGDRAYPCVGAKSAANQASYRLGLYGELAGPAATPGLAHDLARFGTELEAIDARFATFVAIFDGPLELDEATFEDRLWRQLQALHLEDAPHHAWDPSVSNDPADPHFSFSFAGRAWFLVGLQPRASRIARRFPWPAVAFNAHEQFERLRDEGQMERMKEVIHRKDVALQGTPNPVLCDHGKASEARQYAGRDVDADWQAPFRAVGRCPFHQGEAARRGRSR